MNGIEYSEKLIKNLFHRNNKKIQDCCENQNQNKKLKQHTKTTYQNNISKQKKLNIVIIFIQNIFYSNFMEPKILGETIQKYLNG